jgi:hypothetical protein
MNNLIISLCLFNLFFILFIASAEISTSTSDSLLLEAVNKTAGVYRNKTIVKYDDLAKTILLTVANYAYLNHLQNLLCFTDRLGFEPLIFSMDEKLHDVIQETGAYVSYYMNAKLRTYNKASVDSNVSPWRSKQFILISNLKIAAAIDVMALGYHVLFIDPDVALVRDPFPFVYFKNIDYAHSLNVPCDL